jgi:hypothetical protein
MHAFRALILSLPIRQMPIEGSGGILHHIRSNSHLIISVPLIVKNDEPPKNHQLDDEVKSSRGKARDS